MTKAIFKKKDLLNIASLSKEEISLIINTATQMKEISERDIKKVPTLKGKTIILFFYEPSTRTKTSFDIAAKRLSADTISISSSTSSIVKGETLLDTVKNLEAMKPHTIIVRHSSAGVPDFLAKNLNCSVINAGDGMHAHPTQALLDIMTVKERKKTIKGLNIVIIGDIAHSRVARSNIKGFSKMGAKVSVAGPPTMMPQGIEKMCHKVFYNSNDAVKNADVIIMLRVQRERQKNFLFPSEREYFEVFGLNKEKLKKAKKDVLIMHPGPINRGLEISNDIADGKNSIILEQVTNGVAIRMAILSLLAGKKI